MKKILRLAFLLALLLPGCKVSTSSLNSNVISSSSSSSTNKDVSTSSVISSSTKDEELTIDFVINKLNSVINKSYTLNYLYEGIIYEDVFVPNSYYYNDLYKQGKLLANLFSSNTYLFDFEIINNKLNITNQSYNEIGVQGNKELNNINLSSFEYESIRSELQMCDKGVKLENPDIVNFFTMVINDTNTFDYIIFNSYEGNLTFDFYFQDTLYDGYSYMLKDIGNSKNDIVSNYLLNFEKLNENGIKAINTFDNSNVVIKGDINYVNNVNEYNFESLNNIKIVNDDTTKYKLESISNGVSYKQYFVKEDDVFKHIGLDGKNEVTSNVIETKEEEIYPTSLSFLKDCYLVNDEYIYLGKESNEVISSLLINSSSIIIDAWVKCIKFKIIEDKVVNFSFTTFDTVLNSEYVYFKGDFEILNNGVIENITSLEPSNDDAKIKGLLNSISEESSNYKMESTSYVDESKMELSIGEKHVINFVNGVYLDSNYRINNDGSLSIQFANGYSKHNDLIYSFRYDVTEDKIDNVKETNYFSIKEAILSLSSEVLYIDGNVIKVNSLVTDISENVNILEQAMLIDPSSLCFYFEGDYINKITYKYGNSYTSSYVEAIISHDEGSIDEGILTKLNEAYPNISDVKELYLKDSEDMNVLSIYDDLYNNGYNEYADYIPFVPGIESCVEIIWLNDYPEGYQYLINDAPSQYLDVFKDALVNVYGYSKVNEFNFKNSKTNLNLTIKEDYGYIQFYFSIM